MGLYEKWKQVAEADNGKEANNRFWNDYLEKEKGNYAYILENRQNKLEGKVEELAAKFNMEPEIFAGFLDGINTSLVNGVDIDSLEPDTALSAEIDFEKLYWNMHEAKADWLYNLEQWDGILTKEKRDEITRKFRQSKIAVSSKVGRNDPCPCGSGKKYKKCCGK
ncbi:MAG: SEC-C metal-binding domain-containing protein [Clostridiaceae bacterium]